MSGAWLAWTLQVALVLLVLGVGLRVLLDQARGKPNPIERLMMRRNLREYRREWERRQTER